MSTILESYESIAAVKYDLLNEGEKKEVKARGRSGGRKKKIVVEETKVEEEVM